MSGMKITDHKFFAGSGSPRFPKGVHTKDERSAEGAGKVMKYEDTTEAIHAQQNIGSAKIKARPLKEHFRN